LLDKRGEDLSSGEMKEITHTSYYQSRRFWMLVCVLFTFIVMAPNLNSDWVNWDDELFVLNNPLVGELSSERIHQVFTTTSNNGGYTPLVVLSWSTDFAIDGFNASVFHRTNLLLHLLNVCLVFLVIHGISKRLEIAVIVALLFGVHPMQLEAVGWITARKDLLYGLFYLAGLLAYLMYLSANAKSRTKWYVLCLILFLGSLFSKGMAVTFPLALLTIDFIQKRDKIGKLVLEKAPFFALSIFFGLLALSGQQEIGAVDDIRNISFSDSFFVACYGLMTYTYKALLPVHLSSYHPYPYIPGEQIPSLLYASVIPAVLFLFATYFAIKRNRTIAFGMMFFLVCIVMMLQFFPVGLAIISERFTYIAYIGLFFLIAYGAVWLADRYEVKRKTTYTLIGGYIFVLGAITYQRTDVWKDSATLWSDVIEKYPDDFLPYVNRASYYMKNGQFDLAMNDYNQALHFNPKAEDTYGDRGYLFMQMGQLDSALYDLNTAIELNSEQPGIYINRGLVYMRMQRFKDAEKDFRKTIELDTNFALGYYNLGQLFMSASDFDRAVENYTRSIELDAQFAPAHVNLGLVRLNQKKYPEALTSLDKGIALDPEEPMGYFNRGLVHGFMGNHQEAIVDYTGCIQRLEIYAPAYYWRSRSFQVLSRMVEARQDANRAQQLGFQLPEGYIEGLSQ